MKSRVIDGVQQIRAHITLHTNGELILWPYGYTKTNIPPDMTTLDHDTFVALGRAQAAQNGYTAEQSSDLYITDGDQIDWLYATYRIFSFTCELYPSEQSTVWKDHYPDDSKIATQTARNRGAILHLINRAGCPYAALGATALRADCGPLFDDLEINRGWTRNAAGHGHRDERPVVRREPREHVLERAEAAGHDDVRREGARDRRRSPGRAPARTTSTAGRRRCAAGRSCCPPAPRRSARSPSAPTSPMGPARPRTTRCASSSRPRTARRRSCSRSSARPTTTTAPGRPRSRSLAAWAGQTIHLVVEATDGANDSLVEAAIDDIRIRRP